MTKSDAAEFVLEGIRKGGFEAYLVGGCVRDLLLKREPKDYDVTTDARPEEVMELFPKTIPVGAAFGVITVMVEDVPIEVATYRSDGKYADGRHPDIVFYADRASDDVSRRDFTINGLLMSTLEKRPSGEYVIRPTPPPGVEETVAMTKDGLYTVTDYVGGLEDLQEEVIRAIGNPEERFKEDALRMLRACRFAAQLGFTISPETVSAIQYNAALIKKVSVERITAELVKILTSPHPVNGLVPLVTTGLMEHLPFNETVNKSLANIMRRFGKFQTKDADLAMAMFFVHTVPTDVRVDYLLKQVLKMSNDHVKAIAGAVSTLYDMLFAGLFNLNHAQHRLLKMMRNPGALLGIELLEQNLLLHLPPFPEGDVREFRRLIKYLRALTPEEINPPKFVTGEDLIAMGMEPCREMGNILEDVEDMQLCGELADRAAALAVAKRYVSDLKNGVVR